MRDYVVDRFKDGTRDVTFYEDGRDCGASLGLRSEREALSEGELWVMGFPRNPFEALLWAEALQDVH